MCDCSALERWAPIAGYEGYYEVSDHGRVRSLDRVIVGGRWGHERRRGALMARPHDQKGYAQVGLRRDGEPQCTRKIHHLVLETFVGPCPSGQEACHWDDDPDNAHRTNLRWDTRSGNARDRARNGRTANTSKTCCPRDHELGGANNPPRLTARGVRSCWACALAYDDARTAVRQGRPVIDMWATADRRYAELMRRGK